MTLIFLKWVYHFRPKLLLMENVSGILTTSTGHAVQMVIKTLLTLGYQVRLGALNAACYGVPQNRWRIILWGAQTGYTLPEFPPPSVRANVSKMAAAKIYQDNIFPEVVRILQKEEEDDEIFGHSTLHDAICDLPSLVQKTKESPSKSNHKKKEWTKQHPLLGKEEIKSNQQPQNEYQRRLQNPDGKIYNHYVKDYRLRRQSWHKQYPPMNYHKLVQTVMGAEPRLYFAWQKKVVKATPKKKKKKEAQQKMQEDSSEEEDSSDKDSSSEKEDSSSEDEEDSSSEDEDEEDSSSDDEEDNKVEDTEDDIKKIEADFKKKEKECQVWFWYSSNRKKGVVSKGDGSHPKFL